MILAERLQAEFDRRAFSPERFADHRQEEQHRGLAREIVGRPKRAEIRTLTLIGGGSCAGKTTALGTGLMDVSDEAVKINPDTVALDGHEARSKVSKLALAKALDAGASVVFDSVGFLNAANVREKLERARRLGYKVLGEYFICDPDTATERNRVREAETGRHVPESFVLKSHDRVKTFLPKAIKYGLFDRLRIWSTENGTPALVAEAQGDQLTVHDEAAWQHFLGDAEPLRDRFSRAFARVGFPTRFAFDPSKHPRGQPKNKGWFREKNAPASTGFVSPETGAGVTAGEAEQRTHNERQARFAAKAKQVAETLGMKADVRDAIGDWHEPGGSAGSEPTTVIELDGAGSYDDAKFYLSIMARYGRQIAVVPFRDQPGGGQALYSFDVADSVEGIQKTLEENGIQYRTIQRVGDATRVFVFDPEFKAGNDLALNLKKVRDYYGIGKINRRIGRGELFPPLDRTGGDRDAAIRELDTYIAAENGRRGVRGYYQGGEDNWLYRRRGLVERFQREFSRRLNLATS